MYGLILKMVLKTSSMVFPSPFKPKVWWTSSPCRRHWIALVKFPAW